MTHQQLSLICTKLAADEVLRIKHGDRTRAKSSCVLRITFLLHIKGDDSARDKKRKRDDNNAKPDDRSKSTGERKKERLHALWQ